MTYNAILKASDEQLKNYLGLTRLGDRLSLRSFCENHHGKNDGCSKADTDSRKKRLIEELAKKRIKKQHTAQSAQKGIGVTAKSTRKVELSWLHCRKGSAFKAVRMKEGGGTRNVDIPKTANKEEIVKIAEGVFFPDGKSCFGKASEMKVDLFDFKKEKISSSILVDDENVPFTLGFYIDYFKLSKIKLHFYTEIKEDSDEHSDDLFDSDSDQDSFMNISMLHNPQLPNRNEEPDILHKDGLIGSSIQRQELKELIDNAYEESLAIDQANSSVHARAADESESHQEESKDVDDLKRIRNERLPKEPYASDPHYIVSVRHLSLGVLTRMFSLDDSVYSIYDWIGSLPDSPEHFQLCTYFGDCVSPSESVKSVDKCMLVMIPSIEPVIFSPNETVSLRGFGPQGVLDSITEHCPNNFMQEDDNGETDDDLDHES